jgi:hypothetical protein
MGMQHTEWDRLLRARQSFPRLTIFRRAHALGKARLSNRGLRPRSSEPKRFRDVRSAHLKEGV